MVRHIVAFRLSGADDSERSAQVAIMRDALEPLVALDEVTSLVVRPDLGDVDGHWHAVLVSEHPSPAHLKAYQAHPAHVEAAAIVARVVTDRAVVDYD